MAASSASFPALITITFVCDWCCMYTLECSSTFHSELASLLCPLRNSYLEEACMSYDTVYLHQGTHSNNHLPLLSSLQMLRLYTTREDIPDDNDDNVFLKLLYQELSLTKTNAVNKLWILINLQKWHSLNYWTNSGIHIFSVSTSSLRMQLY